ncbi:MAG: MaoC family dehydratase [Pseudomonadota bacterium]
MDDVRSYDDGIVGYFIEDLSVGMSASFQKTVTEADIVLFAGVSGDTNPVHINEEYARKTFFKGRIAHGMLGAAYISTVLGTRMPGPGAVYVSQNLRFRAPIRAGDTVTARVTVADIVLEKRRALMNTMVTVGETVVIEGDATVSLPTRGD